MKTTRKELSEMLATGKVIQEKHHSQGEWRDVTADDARFDLAFYEYRIKPEVNEMKTARQELGEMMATGLPMQQRHHAQGGWFDVTVYHICFNLGYYEYRLKPTE